MDDLKMTIANNSKTALTEEDKSKNRKDINKNKDKNPHTEKDKGKDIDKDKDQHQDQDQGKEKKIKIKAKRIINADKVQCVWSALLSTKKYQKPIIIAKKALGEKGKTKDINSILYKLLKEGKIKRKAEENGACPLWKAKKKYRHQNNELQN